MSHGQIEAQHHKMMNDLARKLDQTFKGYGFCLLVFDTGVHDGRMNYISNCQRDDMVTAMKEFIANHEGSTPPAPTTKQ